MNEKLNTFLANLRYAIHNKAPVNIGGGSFSPEELHEILRAIQAQQDALNAANLLCANLHRGGQGHMNLVEIYELLSDRI